MSSENHTSAFIENLPDSLRQDAYRDADICAHTGIQTVWRITFDGRFRFERGAFFFVAQAAIDSGLTQRLSTDDGLETTVRAVGGPRAHIVITGGAHKVVARRFELLSRDPGKRGPILCRMLRTYNLPEPDEQRWRRLCNIRPLAADEFDALKDDLADTPDGLRILLRRLRRSNQISFDQLVPRSARYYERLVGIPSSEELDPAVLRPGLEKSQRLALSRNLIRSLPLALATAASPALLPTWILSSFGADEILAALKRANGLSDPYSLAAAFELAVAAAERDSRAADLALRIAVNLLEDKARLETKCRLFSGLLIATCASIAGNPDIRHLGPTWRRLAAFSHAAVAHRALYHQGLDAGVMYDEIASRLGTGFYVASLFDKPQLPLWRPLWVMPDHIEADLVGRMTNAVSRTPTLSVKSQLEALISAARERINQQVHPLATMFPSFLEGYVPNPAGRPAPAQVVEDMFQAFASKPATDTCTIAANVAAVANLPADAVPLYAAAIARLPMPNSPTDWVSLLNRLSAAAHAAGVARSVPLADSISDTLFRALRHGRTDPPGLEVVTILIEACGGHSSPVQAREWVGKRLRSLALSVPAGDVLSALVRIIDEQTHMNPSHRTFLGAARAAAALAK